jgi:5,10-methylenetetrahydromethanopterin reductase
LAGAGFAGLLPRPGGTGRHAHRADRRAHARERGADVEVGLGLQSDEPPGSYAPLARRAEEAGFDVISVFHDLLFPPAIAPLLEIADATERVRIGPAALNPYTLHPVEIAGQVAALDHASDGRAYLGLVQGAWLGELGIEQAKPLTALREAVELVRRLLGGDRSGFEGEQFRLAAGTGLHYEPRRPVVPLMLGTWKPRTAAYAGRVAQEVKIGGTANPDMVRLLRRWIGNEDVGIVVGAVTVVDEDGDLARERAREEVAMYLEVVADLDPTLALEPGRPPPLDRFTFAGTPEEVAAHARRLFEAGAARVEFGTPQGSTTALGVELLASRVLPLLRG